MGANLPLVSVVTPAYNQASFLRATIESVLAQDYAHIEYRVINDGSTDRTPEILEEYKNRVQVESQPNRGQTPTINKGLEQSRGDIFIWLNSDDTFLPDAVTKAVSYLERHPDVGIVFGDTLFTEADGTPKGRSTPRGEFDYRTFVLTCENPIPQPSAFIRRAVIDDVGPLDPYYFYFMDWDYWLRAGIRHRLAYFPELLSTYRLHPESNTVARSARVAPELERMYQKFFLSADVPGWIRSLEKPAMANMYFTSGGYYLTGGDRRSGALMAVRALRARPSLLFSPSALHKFVYCLSGGSRVYGRARSLYYRLHATECQLNTNRKEI